MTHCQLCIAPHGIAPRRITPRSTAQRSIALRSITFGCRARSNKDNKNTAIYSHIKEAFFKLAKRLRGSEAPEVLNSIV